MTETAPATIDLSKDERNIALLCHLSGFLGCIFPFGNIIAPLVFWLIKRDESEFLEEQTREALNFQISISIYFMVSFLLIFVLIGIPMMIGLFIFAVVNMIVAAIKVSEGKPFTYPATIRFI